MIEFKAECGHTVRARDEDAGGVVRCSYCGRNAAVPDNVESGLDHLFRELEESGETDRTYRRPKSRRSKRGRAARPAGGGSFDPFSVVLKLCYVAALVIIVWVVVQKAIMPIVRGGKPLTLFAGRGGAASPDETFKKKEREEHRGPGLVGGARIVGLYVSSLPTGASVSVLESSKAPMSGRIATHPGVRQCMTDDAITRLPDGEYLVEVTLPWHDKRLSQYRDYWAFRRSIERASDAERRQLLEEFFIPDDAVDVFVHKAEEQIYLVRQYRATVRRDRSKGVQAIFLPRIPREDGIGFSIEPLVAQYIPAGKRYEFDEELVNNELAYYGVLVADRPVVIEALRRIGVISYVTPDGGTRLFRIGIDDGVFATRIVRSPAP